MRSVVIIGGGISGLACAYRLQRAGVPVLLLEQTQRAGGVICSVRQEGFLIELGPQSFLSTDLLLELIDSVGLTAELLRADPRAPRYILLAGQLHALPLAPPGLLGTSLLSFGSKLRLLSEPLRRTRPPEADESIAAFVRRKFGSELLDHLVGPFISGVYAGDPEKLSLRSAFPSLHEWESKFGSVIRGAMKSRPPKDKPRPALCSFSGGAGMLVRTLGEMLGDSFHRDVSARSLTRSRANGKSTFELEVATSRGIEMVSAAVVVVATPTATAGRLLAGLSAAFPENLERIEYAPVAVVATGYRREQVRHPVDGFGFLVPRSEHRRVLGTVWNSSLFPGRAPDGMVLLTSFAGGATDPALVKLPEDEIANVVTREVSEVLEIEGAPVTRVVQSYERALPQYNLGHGKRLAAIRELAASIPGLFLTGNYFGGPAMGACVEQACQTAAAVQQYLGTMEGSGSTPDFRAKGAPS